MPLPPPKLREQDKEATVYIGNIDERVTDSLIWELMLQAGRIVNVHLPKDRVTQIHQGYGFVEFISEEDAEYAARIMNQVRLYGKPIRVNKVCFVSFAIGCQDRSNKLTGESRPLPINKRPSKLAPNSSLETSIPWLTKRPSTIHSRALDLSFNPQRSLATSLHSPRVTVSFLMPASKLQTMQSQT